MEFPVDLTFRMLGWTAKLVLTDARGHTFGYVDPARRTQGCLPIYSDESLSTVLFAIRWEHGFAQWFEDRAGQRIGEFGSVPTAAGKFVKIGGEARFHFVDETPWVNFFERDFPNLPFVNALTGAMLNPSVLAVRTKPEHPVLRIVKKRQLIDIRFRIDRLNDIDDREQECLLLASMVECLWDHYINFR
jgi:hypothetical protein